MPVYVQRNLCIITDNFLIIANYFDHPSLRQWDNIFNAIVNNTPSLDSVFNAINSQQYTDYGLAACWD